MKGLKYKKILENSTEFKIEISRLENMKEFEEA